MDSSASFTRRDNREIAVQLLYAYETLPHDDLAHFYKLAEGAIEKELALYGFAREIFEGFLNHQNDIDNGIKQFSRNWEFVRIERMDLAIMRMACFEIMCRDDIPVRVSINEALELAKLYSSEESHKFINGILDKVKQLVNKE